MSGDKRLYRSSFLSGEFWLYAVVIGATLYLQYRGYSVAEIKERGDLMILKAGDWAFEYIPMVMALVFGAKRMVFKGYAMWIELQKTKAIAKR